MFWLMEGVILWLHLILEYIAFMNGLSNGLSWAELSLLLKDCITWHMGTSKLKGKPQKLEKIKKIQKKKPQEGQQ